MPAGRDQTFCTSDKLKIFDSWYRVLASSRSARVSEVIRWTDSVPDEILASRSWSLDVSVALASSGC